MVSEYEWRLRFRLKRSDRVRLTRSTRDIKDFSGLECLNFFPQFTLRK